MSGKVTVLDAHVHHLGEDEIVIHGTVDPSSLRNIDSDKYQREVLTNQKKYEGLKTAHREGKRVPDVALNMRGDRYEEYDDGSVVLISPVFMVDGKQRISSAIEVMNESDDEIQPVIVASITVNKSRDWEREEFDIRNFLPTQLSQNVNLRNRADTSAAMYELFRLTENTTFALRKRVQWDQKKGNSLLTAVSFVKVAGRLHSHWGPGLASSADEVVSGLDKIIDEVGVRNFTANVKTFFEIIDEVWGIGEGGRAPRCLQAGFLLTLARVFAEIEEFWEGHRLVVNVANRNRLRGLRINDESYDKLIRGGDKKPLRILIIKELNKQRKFKLTEWEDQVLDAKSATDESEDDSEEDEEG